MDNRLAKRLALVIIVLAVATTGWMAFRWLYNTGTLDLNIGNTNIDATILLTNQKDGKQIVVQNKSGQPKRLRVKKGAYTVLAESGETSFFTLTAIGGWLKETSLSGNLKPEVGRKFIAKDTAICMYTKADVLLSYGCNGSVKDIRLHQAANDKNPPFAYKNTATTVSGTIEGLLDTPSGPQLLVGSAAGGRTYPNHSLYALSTNPNELVRPVPIQSFSELDPSIDFSTRIHGGGFIVYDAGFQNVFYADSFAANQPLTRINAYRPSDASLDFANASITNRDVLALYSSSTDTPDKQKHSEIIFGNTNESVHYRLKGSYLSAYICGEHRLCLISGTGMEVYKTDGSDRPELLYKVSGVKQLFVGTAATLLITDSSIVDFDLDSRQGYVLYSFGSYSFSSIAEAPGGFIVSLQNSDAVGVGLYLSADIKNDFIDKKIAGLSKNSNVKSVSVYENRVYISPDVGEPVYDPSSNQNIYSTAKREAMARMLPGLVSSAGIDMNKYTIINLLP